MQPQQSSWGAIKQFKGRSTLDLMLCYINFHFNAWLHGKQLNELLRVTNLDICEFKLICWGFWISILARSLGCLASLGSVADLLCPFHKDILNSHNGKRYLLTRECQNYLNLWFLVADNNFLLWSKLFRKGTVLCLLICSICSGKTVLNMVWHK